MEAVFSSDFFDKQPVFMQFRNRLGKTVIEFEFSKGDSGHFNEFFAEPAETDMAGIRRHFSRDTMVFFRPQKLKGGMQLKRLSAA